MLFDLLKKVFFFLSHLMNFYSSLKTVLDSLFWKTSLKHQLSRLGWESLHTQILMTPLVIFTFPSPRWMPGSLSPLPLRTENTIKLSQDRMNFRGFPGGSDSKESACNAGDLGSVPWVGKVSWRREWQPTPVFIVATMEVFKHRLDQ